MTGTVAGRQVRVIRFNSWRGASHTFWIDATSMLPLHFSFVVTLDDKRVEVVEQFEYPASGSIERPAGTQVPDCVG